MYVNYVKIVGFRSFNYFETSLTKLTVIIGENDTGKSNFIVAMGLPLSGSELEFTNKRLGLSDINTVSIKTFYDLVRAKEGDEVLRKNIPKVSVTLRFDDAKGWYEKQIVGNWITEVDKVATYEIRYEFKPKDDQLFVDLAKEQAEGFDDDSEKDWLSLPIEHYEYSIISTNNSRQINYRELKNVSINIIGAERDDFSESATMRSNNILSKLLIKTLSEEDKNSINSAYIEFFKEIESKESFQKIVESDKGFENIKSYIDDIECIPNFPNLKNILSNITLGYGDEFLFQKGLGKRNLMYIFLLFSYYKSMEDRFNVCCIEEPEAHLSVNNLRLAIDFIRKSVKDSGCLFQTILTSHNPSTINKLEISNVIAFTGDEAVSFTGVDDELVSYLSKRPNFDTLKLLFADKLILVEGPTEELFINTLLQKENNELNSVEVISIGQKGFKTFLEIWLKLNKGNDRKKIGVVRDYDNQKVAREEHHNYDRDNANITVRTTTYYTFEFDFVKKGNNCKLISDILDVENNEEKAIDAMRLSKANSMLKVCIAMLDDENPVRIEVPPHIAEVLSKVK